MIDITESIKIPLLELTTRLIICLMHIDQIVDRNY